MDWWRDAKLGMFIHWGLYSVPAGEYNNAEIGGLGEWIMSNGKIPVAAYAEYAKQFNPTKFNAEEIVLMAKNAGMKYIVITSKHHDGFALFKSNASKFNIVDGSPFKRDVIAEMAAACKKYDMPFGLYYSQAQDWHHTGGSAMNGQWDEAQKGSMDKYLDEIAVPQVTEILNNYGDIKVLWWDTPTDMTKERAAKFLPEMAKHPNLIFNNRLGGGVEGDLETPEQYIPATGIPGKNWESCMTMNDTWGFKKNDHNWKSHETIVTNLIDIASKGGNYLLNIGPTSEGLVPENSIACLQELGKWMKVNGEAIYGTQASPFKKLDWGRCTQKKDGENTILYLSVFNLPGNGKLIVPPMANKIVKAYPLANPSIKLTVSQAKFDVSIDVSAVTKTDYATVIALVIEGKPDVFEAPEIKASHTAFTDTAKFEIASDIKTSAIKYSINDSVFSDKWMDAKGLITVTKTEDFTVYATRIIDGVPASGITRQKFTHEIPLPAKEVKTTAKGLKYKYYEGKWLMLPDFSKLKPKVSGNIAEVNNQVKQTNYDYAIVYEGYINVPVTGIYTFIMASDDGSRLTIDGLKTLNHDGIHSLDEKMIDMALEKGLHQIKVEFFQAGGGDGLFLKWRYNDEVTSGIDGKYYLN